MKNLLAFIFSLSCLNLFGQTVSAKSNEISLDFSDPNKNNSISIPTIVWTTPSSTVSYLKDGKFSMRAEIKSLYGLNSVKLRIKDKKNENSVKEFSLPIDENSKSHLRVDRNFTLANGEWEIEIIAENQDGFSAKVFRVAVVGSEQEPKKKN